MTTAYETQPQNRTQKRCATMAGCAVTGHHWNTPSQLTGFRKCCFCGTWQKPVEAVPHG